MPQKFPAMYAVRSMDFAKPNDFALIPTIMIIVVAITQFRGKAEDEC